MAHSKRPSYHPGSLRIIPLEGDNKNRLRVKIDMTLHVRRSMSWAWSYQLYKLNSKIVTPFSESPKTLITKLDTYSMTQDIETIPLEDGAHYQLRARMAVWVDGFRDPAYFENTLFFAVDNGFWDVSIAEWYAGEGALKNKLFTP
ncbi:MAG: hypothetical protein JKY86_01235 [Gammaproteobacteria bacterium]|nr:hypothetical protein [Gammaproteobacteria bacterium]